MSTNNHKNRHLSDLVTEMNKPASKPVPKASEERTHELNETYQFQPDSTPQDVDGDTQSASISADQAKITPLIPEEPITTETRTEVKADRQEDIPLLTTPRPQPVQQQVGQANTWTPGQIINTLLLLVILGAIGLSTYWIDLRLNRLQNIAVAQSPVSLADSDQTAATANIEFEQLSTNLANLESRLVDINSKLTSDRSALVSQLSALEARIAQLNIDSQAPLASKNAVAKPAATKNAETPEAEKSSATSQTTQATKESWFVNLGTFYSEESTRPLVKRAQDIGLTPKITMANVGGRPIYRIQLVGIESHQKAEQLAESLETRLKINGLWVGKD